MGYDITDDPYVDPKTKILKNKIGAKTQRALDIAEAEITYIVIATLTRGSKPSSLVFNSKLLLETHKEIFRHIYVWAGKVRTYDISKDQSYFAHASFINQELKRLDEELQSENTEKYDVKTYFIERLAYFYAEYNAIHPFREGNGRVLRTFLRLYALKSGYDIEWANMDADVNIEACRHAFNADNSRLEAMLQKLVVRIDASV